MVARASEPRRSDEERLRHFVAVVAACIGRPAVQQRTLKANLKLVGSEQGELITELDLGDEEHVRSLMLDFRKLIAAKDDAFFYSICKVLERRLPDGEELRCARLHRAAWKEALGGRLHIVHNHRTVGGGSALDVWINGVLFHNDVADAEWYEGLDTVTEALFQHQVRSTLIDCLRVAHVQRNLVKHVLDDGLLNPT